MKRLTRRGTFAYDDSSIKETGIYVKAETGIETFYAPYDEAYPAVEKLCNLEDLEEQGNREKTEANND